MIAFQAIGSRRHDLNPGRAAGAKDSAKTAVNQPEAREYDPNSPIQNREAAPVSSPVATLPPAPVAVPATQNAWLRALFDNAHSRRFEKHALILGEDERNADAIYLIQAGRVKLFLCSADGKEIDLEILDPGEYFGEMELDGAPGSVSAMAMERTQLLAVRRADFHAFARNEPEFAMQLIERLIVRNRKLLKSVKSLALLDVSKRVARLLLELAIEEDGKLVVAEKLSKRDIANRVGATREMASRVFKDLISRGYIRLERQQITIAKPLPQHW